LLGQEAAPIGDRRHHRRLDRRDSFSRVGSIGGLFIHIGDLFPGHNPKLNSLLYQFWRLPWIFSHNYITFIHELHFRHPHLNPRDQYFYDDVLNDDHEDLLDHHDIQFQELNAEEHLLR